MKIQRVNSSDQYENSPNPSMRRRRKVAILHVFCSWDLIMFYGQTQGFSWGEKRNEMLLTRISRLSHSLTSMATEDLNYGVCQGKVKKSHQGESDFTQTYRRNLSYMKSIYRSVEVFQKNLRFFSIRKQHVETI